MNFNKHHPCPICGKTEYCGWVPSQNGILVSCHFVLNTPRYVLVEGGDGRTYVSIDTRNNCGLFEEKTQFERAREDYIKFKFKNLRKQEVFKIDRKNIHATSKNANLAQKIASNNVLNEIYVKFLSFMTLNDKHKEMLMKEKWSNEMICKSNFRSVPDMKTLRNIINILTENYNLEGVPGFYEKEGMWYAKIISGMIIPIYSLEGNIIRLKIKPDWTKEHIKQAEKNGNELPKYIMFSSYKEEIIDGKSYNLLKKGTRSGTHISYSFSENDSFKTVMVTEGEKKSRVVNILRKMPCISLPGVMTYSKLSGKPLEDLKEKGCETIIICYDADKNSNKYVKTAEEELIKLLLNNEFNVYVAEWNIEDGKGIDDLLLAGKKPILKKCKINKK